MSEDERYFNFPIQLLNGFMLDSQRVLNDILNYSVFVLASTGEFDNGIKADTISACNFFGITSYRPEYLYKQGEVLHNSIPEGSPMVGINLNMYWDYRKNQKNDFEKICLLAFLAMRSILQNKAYYKLTNKYWFSRMDGKVKSEAIENLSPEVARFNNEYQQKKIKSELENSWHLITYSRYTRGFYVSFKLNLEKLVLQAEKNRKSNIELKKKIEKEDALKKALLKLGIKRP